MQNARSLVGILKTAVVGARFIGRFLRLLSPDESGPYKKPYQGKFVQDTSKPDGTMRKVMDVSKILHLGWAPKIDLRRGIALAYEDYLDRSKK